MMQTTIGLPECWSIVFDTASYSQDKPFTLMKDGTPIAHGVKWSRDHGWFTSTRALHPPSQPLVDDIMAAYRAELDRVRGEGWARALAERDAAFQLAADAAAMALGMDEKAPRRG